MARGWESKSVEEQMEARDTSATQRDSLRVDAATARRLAELRLQQSLILDQRTASPHRRAALNAALQAVEQSIRALGETP